MRAIVQIVILIFFTRQLIAQVPEETIQTEKEVENFNIPFEKIYLHTDKAHYFSNDTIWFKAYANLKSTVYWNPYVETNIEGNGEIEFTLSDANSDFLIIKEGISKEGEPIFDTYQISTK